MRTVSPKRRLRHVKGETRVDRAPSCSQAEMDKFAAGFKEIGGYFFSTGCTQPAVRMPGDGRKLK